MDIDVLGGLDVLENRVPIAPATPPARQVLALLAAQADQVVPVAVLAKELATCVPPEHARSELDTCVRHLRELLAAALAPGGERTARTVIVQTPGGYLLNTGDGRSDLLEFAREAGAGYRAMAGGDYETAARRLRGALSLWKGPAFDGVTPGPGLTERIVDLEVTRKTVVEQWVEAELARGGHRDIGSALAELSRTPGVAALPAQSCGAGGPDTGWTRRLLSWADVADAGRGHGRASSASMRGGETYPVVADVFRMDAGQAAHGSAAVTSAVRRSLRRAAPTPSMA